MLCLFKEKFFFLLFLMIIFSKLESLSSMMIFLTIIIWFFIKPSFSGILYSKTKTLMYFMFIFIFGFFLTKSLIFFFFFFEMILFPILILIIFCGYQIERFQASNYFLIYAFFCSLPFFGFLMKFLDFLKLKSFSFNLVFSFMMLVFFIPFLAKLPFFLLHFWLPKAHVEAPTSGSIILAAVLLKMGGYGIIRLMMMMKKFLFMFILLGLIGTLMSSMSCYFQSDSKSLIAFSSIAHMNFMISSLFLMFSKMKNICLLVMVSHGFISGLLFFLIGNFFYFSFTRLIYFSFFAMKTICFSLFFFLLILFANFGVPPFISSMSEIMIFSVFIKQTFFFLLIIFFYGMVICYVCVFFLLNLLHGKKSWFFMNSFNFIKDSMVGIFSSIFCLNFFLMTGF